MPDDDRNDDGRQPDHRGHIEEMLVSVPLLASLPSHTIAEMAAETQWLVVPAGAFLFHQGDPAGALAIVWTGRLEVLDEDRDPPRVVGVLNRGAWAGELSLLTGAPRSASVRAVRDAHVLMIPRHAFDLALEREPELGIALARTLAAQVQRTRGVDAVVRRPDTVAVVPLSAGLPVDATVDGILAVAGRRGSPVVLDDRTATDHPEPDRWPGMLDDAEIDSTLAVLVCRDPDAHPEWAAFCCRSADRTVALLRGGTPPSWCVPLLRGRADLAFVGSSLVSARIAPGLATLEPRAHHHLPEGAAATASIHRLARRVTANAIGVVMSGGGARGLAHIGALAGLLDAGTAVDRIGGCSAGALIGALHASGVGIDEITSRCRDELVEHHPFADVTVPRESLIKGKRAMSMLDRLFGDTRIEELSLPYFCVSADLGSGDLVVHRSGPVRDAVAASMAIPGFAPAVRMKGRLHVDGGLLDNFPVDVMIDEDEGPVVGIDVMRDFGAGAATADASAPGIVTTIARSMVLGGWSRSERNRRLADVLISPAVDAIGLFEFDQLDAAIAAGRAAAAERAEAVAALTPDPPEVRTPVAPAARLPSAVPAPVD